ncbi:haloacid dehalogenase type II [Echinicola strongylocentroti]|uniref:Haloacid dehalogenase type II n=1 Tax=Echinicola strongylocentroti TaxID=1795355 RepID=A0A2Z4IEZ0_9BACT|nr:haloacid dehalogenase type II [Echinicola strongylocentroti]AWW29013.1 haloacid dehalogenase type II [Echinicola strongylocentroti]
MKISLAFDVHGTLVDASSVLEPLASYVGGEAASFFETWKYKQREYAFRRRMMEDDVDFSLCTRQALDYACLRHKVEIPEEGKLALFDFSKRLPAYPEAKVALERLKEMGFKLFAFTNGPLDEVKELLRHAELEDCFMSIYSVEGSRTFKPDPAVYESFLRSNHTGHRFTWFISGNSFDVIGAKNIGLKVVWVQRTLDSIMDPWGVSLDQIVKNLDELVAFFRDK